MRPLALLMCLLLGIAIGYALGAYIVPWVMAFTAPMPPSVLGVSA